MGVRVTFLSLKLKFLQVLNRLFHACMPKTHYCETVPLNRFLCIFRNVWHFPVPVFLFSLQYIAMRIVRHITVLYYHTFNGERALEDIF
jgi:hypothetical protein